MSTASALFAPAAPVSTGPSAAAPGAEAVDAGLFSSKVADALNAGVHGAPVERIALGRLTTVPSVGLIMGQAVTAETDTVAPDLTPEISVTILAQGDDLETPSAASDAQETETDETANDNAAGIAASPSVVPEQMARIAPAPTSSAQSTPVEAPITEANGSDADNTETKVLKSLTTSSAGASAAEKPAPTLTAFMAEASEADFAVRATSQPPKDEAKVEDAPAGATLKTIVHELGDRPAPAKSIPAPVETKQTAKVAADNDQSAPAKPAMPTGDLKPAAELRAATRPTTEPAAAPAAAAAPALAASDAAKTASQSTPVDVAKPVALSPIAQALTAAQISAAQVQISVAATTPKPSIIAPAALAVAVKEAELSEATDKAAAPDQPKAAGQTDAPGQPRSPQAPPPLRGAMPEAANETRNTLAPSIEPKPAEAATPSAKIEGDAQPTPPSAKAAESKPAAVGMPAPATPDAPIANAAPADTQVVQQAVQQAELHAHAPGPSTLSRATVETTAQLAAQIARKLDGRSTRFDMVLTPEDLGRVDVSLEIGKDGQLSARLAFDNPAAAADLKGRADELRRQLQDAGFQVAGDALDFSQRDPSTGGGAFERQQQRNALFAGGSRLAAQADMPIVPATGAWINHSLTPDRVDLKV